MKIFCEKQANIFSTDNSDESNKYDGAADPLIEAELPGCWADVCDCKVRHLPVKTRPARWEKQQNKQDGRRRRRDKLDIISLVIMLWTACLSPE